MASSSSSQQQNDAFSGFEPSGKRRKISESSRLFDVFINHRGPDVKHSLATQLYNSLQELGIRAFLDFKEKELGDSFTSTIKTAIHSAAVHIAIFSENYAKSPWCLAELVLMLQSQAKIIPVFHGVHPWELRHIEKGVYASAFTDYENNCKYLEKLKEWKESLQSVSFLTGEEFNSDCENIVKAVRKEVDRLNSKLHVAKYPVRLNKLVIDFERRHLHEIVRHFESQSGLKKKCKEKGQIVGIFGMGGVGKTTLCKELFNRKHSQYTRTCFLFDVREASTKSELPSLQLKLLKDLFDEDRPTFRSIEEGKSCIDKCMKKSRFLSFLIVVDDIDQVEQLDALVDMDMLNNCVNSLVIVTTRDVGVLISTGITMGYHLKAMDREAARELFCWHAFRQPYPANGYEDLVDDFLDECGGLPLSLQVLGTHVHGRNQNSWRLELDKVRKVLPREIQRRLKISFDALDSEEQQIFMDIACFFIDKAKSVALKVWELSGWSAHHALERLKCKCLVEDIERYGWSGRSVLRMHDHLRDLGREMANELSHPNRLWQPQVLKSLEIKRFQAILTEPNVRCFESFKDSSMDVQITYFIGNLNDWVSISTSLLRLELDFGFNTPKHTSIPSWIPLQNLQCFRIRRGHLNRLWESNVQVPSLLKELELFETVLEEFPDLCGMSNQLGKVELNAKQIPIEWLPFLESLRTSPRSLALSSLSNKGVSAFFKSLSSSVLLSNFIFRGVLALNNKEQPLTVKSPMNSLERVELINQDFVTRVLINGYHYPNLESLHFRSMESLTEVDLNMVSTLKSLELRYCENLKRVLGICDLTNLVELNFFACSELEGLPCLSHMTCLERLEIYECKKLNCLHLHGCKKLNSVHLKSIENLFEVDVGMVTTLNSLQLSDCENLKSVLGICDLTNLIDLKIFACPELEGWPCFFHLSCLESVQIHQCKKLKCLELDGCTHLNSVLFKSTQHKFDVDLKRVKTLKGLELRACENLKSVSGICDLTNLLELKVSKCSKLEEFPCLSHLSCLERVEIDGCNKLNWLELNGCTILNTILLQSMENLIKVDFKMLTALKSLDFWDCKSLKSVSGIGDLSKLVELKMSGCSELEELPCLSNLSCLERIEIYTCEKVKCIELDECANMKTIYVSDLPKLVIIRIRHCPELKKLSHLKGLSFLQRITIDGCGKLNFLELTDCENLKSLSGNVDVTGLKITRCPNVEELPCALERLITVRCENLLQNITLPTTLTSLEVEGEELKVPVISDLTKLVKLIICECPKLEELSGLAALGFLETITIQRCEKLQNIAGIEELPSLKDIQLSLCNGAAIRNSIHKLQRVPSERLVAIGSSGGWSQVNLKPISLFPLDWRRSRY